MSQEMIDQINTMANAISTLIDCVGVLAENHPDPHVKMEVASKLAAFAWSEFDADTPNPV